MHKNVPGSVDQSAWVRRCTAEFADAAYFVLLRSGTCGWWIDLELDIWRTLREAVDRPIESKLHMVQNPDDAEAGSQLVLDVLTDAVYRTGLRHGLHGPFLDVELELYWALQRVMCCARQTCMKPV